MSGTAGRLAVVVTTVVAGQISVPADAAIAVPDGLVVVVDVVAAGQMCASWCYHF